MTTPGFLTSHARALSCIARSRARLRGIAAGRGITERSGIVTGLTAAMGTRHVPADCLLTVRQISA